ncbi:MAG: diguanylate cyclase, partial [Lachnospiraceae bacterium]|nr:diguanylate cyclase [Lachnospiraceae bacterium]
DGTEYEIESVKYSDHIQIRIDDGEKVIEVIIALSDSSRFTYMGLTGEYCLIKNVSIKKEEKIIKEDYITRIADRISYIDGEEGSIPNIQIDGHRTDTTEGLPLTDKLEITFNTKSLPTARLIWHCPFFVIYSSDDGSVRGTNYKEYALIRLDGENWDSEDMSENDLIVNTQENFDGWDAWKKHNKEGYECKVTFTKEGNEVTTITENFGIFIKNTTKILSNDKHVYVALTGDQCAMTNIRIN